MHDVWPAPGVLLASRYRLVTLLETGGMAQVWRAVDELLDRPVAVKLPAGDTRAAHLAWREARLAARLQHPGIAAVHDYREAVRTDGSVAPFVVMELLGGETVAARLLDGPMPWGEAVSVGAAVAAALAHAHSAGVVHRDIKPGNVMLCADGVKLLDFGISAAAGEPDDDETGASFGTPAYAAPERLDGKPAEPATDLYGLGVLLFEMVTGQPPYNVDTWEELAAAQATGPSRLPGTLPDRLRHLIDHCLEDEPHRRPSAAEARKALSRLIPSTPARKTIALPLPPPTGQAPVLPVPPRTGSALRRRIGLGVGLAAVLLAFAAVVNAIGDSRSDDRYAQTPAATPTTGEPAVAAPLTSSPEPPSPPASSATSSPTAPATQATPLTVDVALSRVRAAVERGEEIGEIRPDVALDFMNLLRQLSVGEDVDVQEQADVLSRKVRQRLGEEAITEEQAAILQARLADLRGASGT
ncbi:serine/threonine-protein kinase [Actinoplanes sp. NBRC 101535]|nr:MULTISPECIES: serine/threonine-protein kinase [Actinoplanes]